MISDMTDACETHSFHGSTFMMNRRDRRVIWRVRTQHFYVSIASGGLLHRARRDQSRQAEKAKTAELERALEEHLAGKPVSSSVTNPIGCK